MSAADFDDIFGEDPKMDATTAPTLTNVNLDDDELFGGDPTGKVMKPDVGSQPPQAQSSNWEQIGSHEQDEFLSWLDNGESSQAAPTVNSSLHEASAPSLDVTPPPAPVPAAPAVSDTFSSVSFDDNDDFDRMLESANTQPKSIVPTPATFDAPSNVSLDDDDGLDSTKVHASPLEPVPTIATTFSCTSPDNDGDLDRMLQTASSIATESVLTAPVSAVSFDDDDDLEQIVKSSGASTFVPTAAVGSISLDDDDDDDLERIVQKANKQANAGSSRESSSSSLQIKSQVQAQHKPQVDVTATRQTFLETGELPAGSRLAVWQRAVQPGVEDSASMYAVQTTSRSLPSQALLRKEVEALCSRIFSSAAHGRVLREVGDNMRGTHLLFIDSAETLLTHLCTQFDIDYFSGMVLTFAPLLVASGSEPLHPETVETLAATCRRFLPHICKKIPLRSSTTGRRPLLKRMLLYHSPRLASHLSEHFPTWNHAPPEEYDGTKGSGAIADSWLSSFFEGEGIVSDPANFDFLLKVWDCNLILEAFTAKENAPLTTGCYITLYAIISAQKALMRMQGEQLRHCMAATVLDTLLHGDATKSQVFVNGIRHLMNATPPCIHAKLRNSGVPPPPVVENDATKHNEAQASNASNGNFGMNTLLSASTQGLKDVSNMMIDMPVKLMIDMPVKLLTMVPLNPMAALSSPTSNSLTDSPETQQLFYLHVQAMEVASVSVTLEASEVIPSVFGGIQGHETGSLRYFIVDCRGLEEMRRGQVPTAFHFDPDTISDPTVLDHVLATLGPLKSAGVHVCVMGHGYAHIAEELRQFQQKQGVSSSSPFSLSEEFLETYANDQTRVQSTVEFLLKHEFPRVSVLDGGYSAAHAHLFRSLSLTVDDLADHDTPNCKLCQHDRSMEAVLPPVSTDSSGHEEQKVSNHEDDSGFGANDRTGSSRTSEASPHPSSTAIDDSEFTDINLSSTATNTKTPPSGSYYSSFTGAFKSGGKTLLSPTMDGTKWLLKKSAATTAEFANAAANMSNIGNKNRTGSMQGAADTKPSTSPTKDTKPAMPNLNKLRNSLVAIGSESLDMLKKVEHAVEQAAVATTTTAKVRVPFPSSLSPSTKETGATASPATAKSASVNTPPATTPPAPRASLSTDPAHSKFFHQSTDEMFTIDDDDDDEDSEGHFVQDIEGSGSRTSSTSSFARDSPVAASIGAGPVHDVIKGHVSELKKGMTVSRTQMLPCLNSPFFACYKKKAPTGNGGAVSHASMHPRRVVVMENHLAVLKSATRNEDDLFIVKSCHPLSHITRMTCLKKNALMVSIYYKWKAADGQIIERRNSYEVQQRDDFIKAVKTTMDKM